MATSRRGFSKSKPSVGGFGKGSFPTAGPKPWKTSVGGTTNVFRKPIRKGFK